MSGPSEDTAGGVRSSAAVDIAAGLVLAAAALFALVWLVPANTRPASSAFDVAPGFFPSLAAWAVLILSIALVLARLRRLAPAEEAGAGFRVVGEIALWAAVASATVAGLSTVGFLPTAMVLMAATMAFAGVRRWWLIALWAAVFPLLVERAAWLVFTVDLP